MESESRIPVGWVIPNDWPSYFECQHVSIIREMSPEVRRQIIFAEITRITEAINSAKRD